MTAATATKQEDRKRHQAYLFWGAVVIAASFADTAFNNKYVTVAKVGIAVLALFRLLSYDKKFMRIHKAFRSASSIETAKMGQAEVKKREAEVAAAREAEKAERSGNAEFVNTNLNKKLKQHI